MGLSFLPFLQSHWCRWHWLSSCGELHAAGSDGCEAGLLQSSLKRSGNKALSDAIATVANHNCRLLIKMCKSANAHDQCYFLLFT
mmetsp:Transcript_41350/g.79222  ORF Transcript_41350/g.79222 Transcript_41350/m.79222 type:complete len:85 (+) Transcript_41350:161-415(+)